MSLLITLDGSSPSIQYLQKKDKRLAKIISMVGPLTYEPHTDNPFPFLIHEIIEQMLSIKAGAKIYGRLVERCGGVITPEALGQLSLEEIRSGGTSQSKAKAIAAAAEAVRSGQLDFRRFPELTNEEVLAELRALPGIGSWTAKMYLLFVLDRQDILPYEDVAFLQAYSWLYKTDDRSRQAVEKKCRKWKPYSSIAARYLYKAYDKGLTKEEFHLFKD